MRGISSRIPGIGDLPVIGALFRSVNFQRSVTELVVLVTPEIVAPLEPHQLTPLPGESRTDPNDFELYFLGRLEGEAGADATTPDADHHAGGRGTAALVRSDPEERSVHGPWGIAGGPKTR